MDYVLNTGEGNYEPNGLPALANNEIELVRQWILYGAPDTGIVVDTAMVNAYYRTGGMNDCGVRFTLRLRRERVSRYITDGSL